jgi:hypothetical protein
MRAYKRYCKCPVLVRWLFFLPFSFVGAIALAWSLRFIVLVSAPKGVHQIVADLAFPALCQLLFLGLIFYTVPKWKMGWVKFFFIIRTIFSIGYVIFGVVGLCRGVEAASEWEYWKAGIAEGIVFFGSLYIMYELKNESLPEIDSRNVLTENLIKE